MTRGAMRAHQLAIHSPPGTIFCRDCLKVYSNADDLNLHRQQCKSKIKKEAESECNICGKRGTQSNLAKHKVAVHSKNVIFCRTCCARKFKTPEELEAHKPGCKIKRRNYKNRKESV